MRNTPSPIVLNTLVYERESAQCVFMCTPTPCVIRLHMHTYIPVAQVMFSLVLIMDIDQLTLLHLCSCHTPLPSPLPHVCTLLTWSISCGLCGRCSVERLGTLCQEGGQEWGRREMVFVVFLSSLLLFLSCTLFHLPLSALLFSPLLPSFLSAESLRAQMCLLNSTVMVWDIARPGQHV